MKENHPHNDTWKAGFHAYRNIVWRLQEMSLDEIDEAFRKKAEWFAEVEGLLFPPDDGDVHFIWNAIRSSGLDPNRY